MKKFEVIIIGGGATGSCIARDLSLRGINCCLIDRGDIASETSSKNHGLLHSGMRYVIKDFESAVECATENKILRKIAKHVIDDQINHFVSINENEFAYAEKALKAAKKANVYFEEVEIEKLFELEPEITPQVQFAVKTKDSAIDSFRWTIENALSAKFNGATILTYHNVDHLLLTKKGHVRGVKATNLLNKERKKIEAEIVVNAAGPWAGEVAALANIQIPMVPSKGTMVVFGRRICNGGIQRLRPSGDGDILVAHQTTSILGTTSIPVEDPDKAIPTWDEAERQINDFTKVIPSIAQAKVIRLFCGVRPLVEIQGKTGREASRSIILIDHENEGINQVNGFITITSGKLITSRHMAEITADLVAKKLGNKSKCQTHKEPLPGSRGELTSKELLQEFRITPAAANRLIAKQGARAKRILEAYPEDNYTLCECENILASEIRWAINSEFAMTLDDIRRRTRVGMGVCQGTFCAQKIMGIITKEFKLSQNEALKNLESFYQERWKGMNCTGLEGGELDQLELFKTVNWYFAGLKPPYDQLSDKLNE
ncbi:MAG: anaerobic glycerol-3-phosphate dehydrogenase subunit A [Candidatus Heimdallarchaeota archaeon]|nr:anaerobic glycerol-3-phosphate dehydrogenase subunit A [Candidatus Heimdallarchaeota archaeon]